MPVFPGPILLHEMFEMLLRVLIQSCLLVILMLGSYWSAVIMSNGLDFLL